MTAPKIFALWNGGAGYSAPYAEDCETFPSIKAASDALRSRAEHGSWQPQTFDYVHKDRDVTLTPNADSGASMWLYAGDPALEVDAYPFLLLELGPRGGITRTRL